MASYLITGSARGLGLELVKQLVRSDAVAMVLATSRGTQPSESLQKILDSAPQRTKYIPLDTTNSKSITNAVTQAQKTLGSKGLTGLDILINNAGIQIAEPGGTRSMDDSLSKTLDVNVIAVHHVTAAFLPLLQQGKAKKIINISSTLGSITMKDVFKQSPTPSYKISKAALNMLTVQYSADLGPEGFTVLAISPGWLKTDLGSSYADLEVHEGATAVLKIVRESTTEKDNGKFLNIHIEGNPTYDGKFPGW